MAGSTGGIPPPAETLGGLVVAAEMSPRRAKQSAHRKYVWPCTLSPWIWHACTRQLLHVPKPSEAFRFPRDGRITPPITHKKHESTVAPQTTIE
jgi:hypothetical protein